MYKIINRKKLVLVAVIDFIVGPVIRLLHWSSKLLYKTGPGNVEKPKKILVVRFAYIGDVILVLPALPILREKYPEAEITFLTATKTAPLLNDNPYIDRVLIYDAPWMYGPLSAHIFHEYFRFVMALRKEEFDLGIDMRSDIRNIFFVLFMGKIKRRVAFDYGGGAYFLTDVVPYSHVMHKVELHTGLVYYLGGTDQKAEIDLFVTEAEKNDARQLIQQFITAERPLCFAIHAGAREILKRWDSEKYAELTKRLIETYPCCVVILGEKSDENYLAPIFQLNERHVYSLIGAIDLRQLIAVIQQCTLLVCNDSAPMHIADFVNTPTVTIFGPSKSMETGPYNFGHRIVEKNFLCRYKCDEKHCLFSEYKACLNAVTVDDVFKAIHDLVQHYSMLKDVA